MTVALLVKHASAIFKVDPVFLRLDCRFPDVVLARSAVIKVAHDGLGYSFSRIGSILGKHHTSVGDSYRRVERYARQSDVFRRNLSELTELCNPIHRKLMSGSLKNGDNASPAIVETSKVGA